MFSNFPQIKVVKSDATSFGSKEFKYVFLAHVDGRDVKMNFFRYPHIYTNENAWLRQKRRSFKAYAKNMPKERPVGEFYI